MNRPTAGVLTPRPLDVEDSKLYQPSKGSVSEEKIIHAHSCSTPDLGTAKERNAAILPRTMGGSVEQYLVVHSLTEKIQ